MNRRLAERVRELFRRGLPALLSAGLDAALWIERESLFSLEARTGAAVFGALFAIAFLPGAESAVGPAVAPLLPHDALCSLELLALAAVIGTFLGAALRNAWNFVGYFVPAVKRTHATGRVRVAVTVAWVLFAHLRFLLRDMGAHPALYEQSFWLRGGLPSALQNFAVGPYDGWLAALHGAAVGLVLAVAVVEWLRRLAAWFGKFPLPVRLASAVLGGGCVLGGLGLWTVQRVQALHNAGPNLLIIAVDSLRSDMLETRAGEPPAAPHIAALAKQSRAYMECVSPVPSAAPALYSFFSGRAPFSGGPRFAYSPDEDFAWGQDGLPALLRRQGYFTAAYADSDGTFFARVRENFDEVRAPDRRAPSLGRERALRRQANLLPYLAGLRGRQLFPELRGLPELADPDLLADEASGALKRLRFRKKFCLTLFFSAAHAPYAISSPTAASLLGAYDGRTRFSWRGRGEPDDPRVRDRIRRLYRANVRAVDAGVQQVLDALRRFRLDENTVVVLWSPYGENLFENGFGLGQGRHLRGQAQFAAPLLVLEPRKRTAARAFAPAVRTTDALPTVLDTLGLQAPAFVDGLPLKWRDFSAPADETTAVYAETDVWPDENYPAVRLPYPPLEKMLEPDQHDRAWPSLARRWEDHVLVAKQRMIQVGSERLVYVPTRAGVLWEYYDFSSDPEGLRNLAGRKDLRDRMDELREMLFRGLSREHGWRPQNEFWIPEAFLAEGEDEW